jgi:hypothetical protein
LTLVLLTTAGVASATTADTVAMSDTALAAGSVTLRENAQLHLAHSNGLDRLYEQGSGTGTFANAPIHLNLIISTSSEVTYEFSAALPGGSVTGRGRTHYYEQGSTSYFNGTLSVTSGTGRYAHASASLPLSGAMNRRSYALTLHVSGVLRF